MKNQATGLKDKRVVIVSNRLPVSVGRKDKRLKITPSIGGLATGLSSYHRKSDGLWVGWPGINPTGSKEKEEIETTLRESYNCLPVYLSAADMKKYYYGFSNKTLWPLFHYFSTYCTYVASEWKAYQKVNQMFCRRLVEVLEPNDMVWIHDYHLLLLPNLLREHRPDVSSGLFLHIPFPSMEIFRYLPWREEILKGMLGADLIGFHTYDYARHFLSCVLRIMGKEHEYGQVAVGNRMVRVDTFPMGIDAKKYAEAVSAPAVVKQRNLLQKKLETEKIVLSIDRLDFSKGIPERLRAFELFLEKNPQWHGRITYIMLCVPSRTKVLQYRLLKKEVDELVGRINGRFDIPGWLPILYMYRSLPFEELVALYSIADLALVTPLRDGMNLVAKEYLACQGPVGKGLLVLSETAGAAAELGEALIVNPNDLEMMASAIAAGLSAGEESRKKSLGLMAGRIEKYNIFRWTEDFVGQLLQTRQNQEENRQRFLVSSLQDEVKKSYEKAAKRLLLLDYDGTLMPLKERPELAYPDPGLLKILTALKTDPGNKLVLISGRDRDFLARWFDQTGLDLVAEHGTWIRKPDQEKWILAEKGLTDDWKDNVYPIFEMFAERTPGSFIEEKTYALAWHYRKAEPELGTLRSKELMDALHDLLSGTSLQVLPGNKVVEVKPVGINKGKAALHWLEQSPKWDFILAMGDDWTDEDIFNVLPAEAWSIKVGLVKLTRARYLLESPEEARTLLNILTGL